MGLIGTFGAVGEEEEEVLGSQYKSRGLGLAFKLKSFMKTISKWIK